MDADTAGTVGKVPIGLKITRLELAGGGFLHMRRLRRTEIAEAMELARFDPTNEASKLRLAEKICRASILGPLSISCPFTGKQIVEPGVSREGELSLVSRDIFDALNEKDSVTIMAVAQGRLSEDLVGKSEPPAAP